MSGDNLLMTEVLLHYGADPERFVRVFIERMRHIPERDALMDQAKVAQAPVTVPAGTVLFENEALVDRLLGDFVMIVAREVLLALADVAPAPES